MSDYPRVPVLKDRYHLDPAAEGIVIDPTTVPYLHDGIGRRYGFERVSQIHGRSVIDTQNRVFTRELYADSFGNALGAYSIKGAGSTPLTAKPSSLEPTGVRVDGLFDSDLFTRCRAASQVLRSAGVMSEVPIMTARPRHYHDGDQERDLRHIQHVAYSRGLVEWGAMPGGGKLALMPGRKERITHREAFEMGDALTTFKPGVMYRAMATNTRIFDLVAFEDKGVKQAELEFAIIARQANNLGDLTVKDEIDALDPERPFDQATYAHVLLPNIVGEYVARMHNAGVAHRYLHPGNITLAGEIVDLDSVVGASLGLGDEEPTPDQLAEDYRSLPDIVRHTITGMSIGSKIEEVMMLTEGVAIATATYHNHANAATKHKLETGLVQTHR